MNKVILIGLDGATWKVVKPWVDKGYLPTFKKLMDRGVWGVLKSTIPCLTCPAIPALYTGKNPGKLGFSSFIKPDGSLMSYNDIREQTIWDILGEHAYKSAIINLRTTYPPKKLNGIMISGFVPSESSEYTYPKDLKRKIEGFHSEAVELWTLKRKGRSSLKLRQNLAEVHSKKMLRRYEIFKNLLREANYDFMFYWIDETDSIQHWCWNQQFLVLDIFQQVDDILSDITGNSQKYSKYNLLLVSDHGFFGQPNFDFNVNSWLMKEGYLKLRGGRFKVRLVLFFHYLAEKMLPKLPKFFRCMAKTTFKKIREKEIQEKDLQDNDVPVGIDLRNTIAYSDNFWGIRIVKKYSINSWEAITNEIIDKLNKLMNKDGEKIIDGIWRREEIYSGVKASQFPEIIYLTTENFFSHCRLSSNVFQKSRKSKVIQGSHGTARKGVFLAYGPDIREGEALGELDITDIAPTILHLYNLPVPKDMDGKVPKEIFKVNSDAFNRPVRYQEKEE